ncbi:hypothetical protein JKP88DRAFT_260801 [Tribonema minus]|uniref:Uncharacterized protein n=1 Tax=Tribonema minus TaxID=303371 RepID=A0A835ZIP7_9STRA|nr:hypothetical protein JKP88DRAFT_260801 [Tribonema minus]
MPSALDALLDPGDHEMSLGTIALDASDPPSFASPVKDETVFQLKMENRNMREKLNFLTGTTNGAELTGIIMEKESEIRTLNERLVEQDQQITQLVESLKKGDTKREKLRKAFEAQEQRALGFETALNSQFGVTDSLRATCATLEAEGAEKDATIAQLQGDQLRLQCSSARVAAHAGAATCRHRPHRASAWSRTCDISQQRTDAELAAAHAEASDMRAVVETQRRKLEEGGQREAQLRELVDAKKGEVEALETRRSDLAARARGIKQELEKSLGEEKERGVRLVAELEAAQTRGDRLQAELEQQTALAQAMTADNAVLSEAKATLEEKVAQSESACARLSKHLAAEQAALAACQHQRESAQQEAADLAGKLEVATAAAAAAAAAAQQEATVLRARIEKQRHQQKAELEDVLKQMREMEKMSDAMTDVLKADLDACQAKLAVTQQECLQLSRKHKEQLSKVADLQRNLDVQVSSHKKVMDRMESEIQQLRQEALKCRREVANAKQVTSENEALKDKIRRQEALILRKMEEDSKKRRGAAGAAAGTPAAGIEDVLNTSIIAPAFAIEDKENILPVAGADIASHVPLGVNKHGMGDKPPAFMRTPGFASSNARLQRHRNRRWKKGKTVAMAERKRRMTSLPSDDVMDMLQHQYNMRTAYMTVLCAVNEQVKNFAVTGMKCDSRAEAEMKFEEALQFKRGAYAVAESFLQESGFTDLCAYLGKAEKLLPRAAGRTVHEADDEGQTDTDGNQGAEADEPSGGGGGGEMQSFRADRRLLRILIARHFFKVARSNYAKEEQSTT